MFWAVLKTGKCEANRLHIRKSWLSMRFHRGVKSAPSVVTFGEKRYANTMHSAPKLTETRPRPNTGSRSACCSIAGLKSRIKSANPAAGRARRLMANESSSFEHSAGMVQSHLAGQEDYGSSKKLSEAPLWKRETVQGVHLLHKSTVTAYHHFQIWRRNDGW